MIAFSGFCGFFDFGISTGGLGEVEGGGVGIGAQIGGGGNGVGPGEPQPPHSPPPGPSDGIGATIIKILLKVYEDTHSSVLHVILVCMVLPTGPVAFDWKINVSTTPTGKLGIVKVIIFPIVSIIDQVISTSVPV